MSGELTVVTPVRLNPTKTWYEAVVRIPDSWQPTEAERWEGRWWTECPDGEEHEIDQLEKLLGKLSPNGYWIPVVAPENWDAETSSIRYLTEQKFVWGPGDDFYLCYEGDDSSPADLTFHPGAVPEWEGLGLPYTRDED